MAICASQENLLQEATCIYVSENYMPKFHQIFTARRQWHNQWRDEAADRRISRAQDSNYDNSDHVNLSVRTFTSGDFSNSVYAVRLEQFHKEAIYD